MTTVYLSTTPKRKSPIAEGGRPIEKTTSKEEGVISPPTIADLGAMIKDVPKNKGTQGQLAGRDSSGTTQVVAPENAPPTLAELGAMLKALKVSEKVPYPKGRALSRPLLPNFMRSLKQSFFDGVFGNIKT